MDEKAKQNKEYIDQITTIMHTLEADLAALKNENNQTPAEKELAAFKAHKKALFEIKGVLHKAGKLLDYDPNDFDALKIMEALPFAYGSEMPFQPYLY